MAFMCSPGNDDMDNIEAAYRWYYKYDDEPAYYQMHNFIGHKVRS